MGFIWEIHIYISEGLFLGFIRCVFFPGVPIITHHSKNHGSIRIFASKEKAGRVKVAQW